MSVYGGYNQQELDAQYNLRARHPDHPAHFARWAAASQEARLTRRCDLDLRYGDDEKQSLDIFRAVAREEPHPILAFIHGGFWQSMDKADFSFVAPSFTDAGVAVAVVDYRLAPAATIDEIIADSRAALAWVWRNASRFQVDPSRVFVCGHSAGGHLTAEMLATAWSSVDPAFPQDLVKGGCAISGLYDLEPIRLSFLNRTLGMTPADARRASPLFKPPPGLPLLLSVGGDETKEFHRQQADLVRLWSSSGGVEEVDMPGCDHFTIVDALADADTPLHRAVLRLVGGGSGTGRR